MVLDAGNPWLKFEDRAVAMHLALTGAIKSEILSFIEIGEYFIDFLRDHYPDALRNGTGSKRGFRNRTSPAISPRPGALRAMIITRRLSPS